MLTALATGFRFRLAMAFMALAAVCLVLPPAAMAFGHGEMTAHCLQMAATPQHGVGPSMQHGDHGADPAAHHGADPDGGDPAKAKVAGCCGLFCLNAVMARGENLAEVETTLLAHLGSATASFHSRAPEGLDRPPKSLLFV